MEMHSVGTPEIDADECIGCGMCVKNCANDGVHVIEGKAVINEDNCLGCGHCFGFCPKGAINSKFDEAPAALSCKIAEYAQAVLDGKPAFHISLIRDVSPLCDCDPGNDVPIIPDVGMFASFDPVAMDQACVDACNRQPIFENSMIGEHAHEHKHGESKDVFRMVHPDTDWEAGLVHAEKIGLGTREYELVEL